MFMDSFQLVKWMGELIKCPLSAILQLFTQSCLIENCCACKKRETNVIQLISFGKEKFLS